MTSRRDFVRQLAVAGGALKLRGLQPLDTRARARLDILILGGTGLTGPYQVSYALARGHAVTVFNRGRHNDKLPQGVTELIGDRNLHQLDSLRGKTWDVVIDNPSSLPFWVKDAGEVLKGHTKQYVFISSISAYDTKGQRALNERSPLLEYTKGDPLAVTQQDLMKDIEGLYGPMKVACEREAVKWFGNGTTIIRPTLIAGPGDDSFRFTYWPYRIAKGGDILAPGDGKDQVQVIDARDLAEWTIRVVEQGTIGTFNAAGPAAPMTMSEQLEQICTAVPAPADTRFVWVPTDFLTAQKVTPWGDMPTWIPRSDPDYAGTQVSNARARAAGLTFRPVGKTAKDALDWFNASSADARTRMLKSAGLPPDRERDVLVAWRASRG